MRSWRYKYEQWFCSSFTGTTPFELQVDTFLCFMDNWWLNRLRPKVRRDTCVEDLWMLVEEEMKIQWPISRRREMLFDCRQKRGQAASDFYLDLKTLAQDCEIDKLGQKPLLCHLLVKGLMSSE